MKILTFGEIMMRFQPQNYGRFIQAQSYEMNFGGGEANVAVALAQFGCDAAFCTKLPDNPLADACVNTLRGFGVDTRHIVRGGSRIGIYFSEKGASQRSGKVIYDRADSAITEISVSDVDIAAMVEGVGWFHFTGITPALGEKPLAFLEAVLKEAKSRGVTVSCDLNYRGKLWTREKAKAVMTRLMKYTDVLISNEEDVRDVFGMKIGGDVIKGGLSADDYAAAADKLTAEFGFKAVAFTLRESFSASENGWSALLWDGRKAYVSKKYNLKIVDRIGGGDSFAAGLIYALVNSFDNAHAVNFAAAASALKHSIEGDFNLVGVDEVEKLAGGDGSGRVQR